MSVLNEQELSTIDEESFNASSDDVIPSNVEVSKSMLYTTVEQQGEKKKEYHTGPMTPYVINLPPHQITINKRIRTLINKVSNFIQYNLNQ